MGHNPSKAAREAWLGGQGVEGEPTGGLGTGWQLRLGAAQLGTELWNLTCQRAGGVGVGGQPQACPRVVGGSVGEAGQPKVSPRLQGRLCGAHGLRPDCTTAVTGACLPGLCITPAAPARLCHHSCHCLCHWWGEGGARRRNNKQTQFPQINLSPQRKEN